MKDPFIQKQYAEDTGKLHISCLFKEETGIKTHVVVKDGYCYRSGECLIVWCKYNRIQTDFDSVLSLLW